MTEEISTADLCEFLELTPQRLSQLVAIGVLARIRRGVYDKNESIRGYINYLRSLTPESRIEHRRMRIRLTSAKADKLELENKERRRELMAKGIL